MTAVAENVATNFVLMVKGSTMDANVSVPSTYTKRRVRSPSSFLSVRRHFIPKDKSVHCPRTILEHGHFHENICLFACVCFFCVHVNI